MPMPRKYASDAEKQAAWRKRKGDRDLEAYNRMRGFFWRALEEYLATADLGSTEERRNEERHRYYRLFVKHLPSKNGGGSPGG